MKTFNEEVRKNITRIQDCGVTKNMVVTGLRGKVEHIRPTPHRWITV